VNQEVYQNYTVAVVPGPHPKVSVHPPIVVSDDHATACTHQLRTLAAAGKRFADPSRPGTGALILQTAVEVLMSAWDDAGVLRRPIPKVNPKSPGGVEFVTPPGATRLDIGDAR
jgi:hypothetical protein